MSTAIIMGLIAVIIIQGVSNYIQVKKQQAMHSTNVDFVMSHLMEENREWRLERQQLLDRIQSPSFTEYKHQEVRVIKANNNVPEPPKLEVM